MARSNRTVVADGWYHITARAHAREFLLRDDKFKSRLVDWIYGIADFSGVEVGAWTIMDNHLHLLVRVPPVPERLWTRSEGTVPTSRASRPEGTVPASWAFGMRPPECRAPRWTPDTSDAPVAITPAGTVPVRRAAGRRMRRCSSYEETLPDGKVRRVALRITQAVHVRQRAFTHGTVR